MTTCNYCKNTAVFTFKNGINCCSKNVSGCPEIRQRKKNTCIEKYGDENFKNIERAKHTKLEKYGSAGFNNRIKAKETSLEKYGVDNISKLEKIKKQKEKTFQNNYKLGSDERLTLAKTRSSSWLSNDVKSIIKKSKNTTTERYGVDNILKLEEVALEVSRKNKENAKERLEKAKKTIKERYGVEYISQVTENYERQQKCRWKSYVLPSGKIINVQGFEDKALDILLTLYKEEDIIINRHLLPKIWYTHKNIKRRYYPDLMIISNNTIIEVKSEYTYKVYEESNLKKKDACIQSGYNFEFWIFDKKTLRKQTYKHDNS
jgi:hypothetical protein